MRDKVTWAAGRRAAGFVFCSPFIKFTMTNKFLPFTRTHTQAGFTLTRDFALFYQDWQKTRQPRRGSPLIKPATVIVNCLVSCMLDSIKQLTITKKARFIYRDKTCFFAGISNLDSYILTSNFLHIYQN